jgi:hypothetical protein
MRLLQNYLMIKNGYMTQVDDWLMTVLSITYIRIAISKCLNSESAGVGSQMRRPGDAWPQHPVYLERERERSLNNKHLLRDADTLGYALCRRPPDIAHCFRIAEASHCCKRILASLVPRPVIWHARWLNFGVLGDLGTILGHSGSQQRTLCGPCSDFINFRWI